ncbi:MAG: BON domain-containing protein, partial [Alphaproteobacteria bacterium]|nr:BON domain-containing protein [Alphaproteobacteria bacterium]
MLYIIGKGIGQTSITVVGADGRAEDRAISVELDLDPLRAALAGKPELEGVTARPFAHGVALTGEVASASLAARAIRLAAAALPQNTPVENELRVTGAQQVNLEVQIAEVQRSISEDLGINWEAFGVRDGDVLGFRIGRLVTANFPSSFTGGDFTPGIFEGEVSPSVFFGRDTPGSRVMGMVEALSQAGLANVLARPNVTAISGESASLFSGGEFPLPTGFDEGVLVFEYKKYGILLDFVPTVIDSSRISMHVRPEVSEPSINRSVQISGVTVPVINVRRAETTVEVADGESIVIAGLFRNASNSREAGLPVLKDVPGLGLLFGNRSTRSDELELIVIVTARLVEPGKASGESRAPAS